MARMDTDWSPSPVPAAASDDDGWEGAPSSSASTLPPWPRTYHVTTHGCQQNDADTGVVEALLQAGGLSPSPSRADAHVVLFNTCSVREAAEARVLGKLAEVRAAGRKAGGREGGGGPPRQLVAVLGCMAENLRAGLVERGLADVVAGPDSYRDLPRLLSAAAGTASTPGEPAVNVALSTDETYADVVPVARAGSVGAHVSVMRGCNNMCTFCIVPAVRGRERSRPLASVVEEVKRLAGAGVREVTLLGQNVNSYADWSGAPQGARRAALTAARSAPAAATAATYAPGFASVYTPARTGAAGFADLLAAVAAVDPDVRVRFTSPHPKDFHDSVLDVVAAHPNVCKQVHMPAQSGSDSVLGRMRRGYTRAAYDALAARVRAALPGVALSTDVLVGFCGETEAEHEETLHLLRAHAYESAFLFAYSSRPRTPAARSLADDVPAPVKAARLAQAIEAYRAGLAWRSAAEVGRTHVVLVEGPARRAGAVLGGGAGLADATPGHFSTAARPLLTGRTCHGRRVLLEAGVAVPATYDRWAGPAPPGPRVLLRPGDYVAVRILRGPTGSLPAAALGRTSLADFVRQHGSTLPFETGAGVHLAAVAGG